MIVAFLAWGRPFCNGRTRAAGESAGHRPAVALAGSPYTVSGCWRPLSGAGVLSISAGAAVEVPFAAPFVEASFRAHGTLTICAPVITPSQLRVAPCLTSGNSFQLRTGA